MDSEKFRFGPFSDTTTATTTTTTIDGVTVWPPQSAPDRAVDLRNERLWEAAVAVMAASRVKDPEEQPAKLAEWAIVDAEALVDAFESRTASAANGATKTPNNP